MSMRWTHPHLLRSIGEWNAFIGQCRCLCFFFWAVNCHAGSAPPALGRLFFTPEQRQALDRNSPGPNVTPPAQAGTSSRPRFLRVDGYLIRSTGASVWIDGEERVPGERAPDGVRISLGAPMTQIKIKVGRVSMPLKVGDYFNPDDGRVERLILIESADAR